MNKICLQNEVSGAFDGLNELYDFCFHMQANLWQMWTQLWKGSIPYSLNKILMVILIHMHNSDVLQLCNISWSHDWIRLKYTSLLFDVIWPYNANMAEVGVLVTWKKYEKGRNRVI